MKIFLTFCIGLLGGVAFSLAGLPVPWLLGPMAATLIGSFFGLRLYWPVQIRDAALIIVGYSLGLSFTAAAVSQIAGHFLSIIIMTLLLIGYCTLTAAIVSKFSGISYRTVLIGSIPGGLSQMIALSEEMEGTDPATVTLFQVSRLLLIIFIVPFTAAHSLDVAPVDVMPASGLGQQEGGFFPEIFIYALFSVVSALLGKKAGLPTAFLTGPLLITGVLTASGMGGPVLPDAVMDLSQFMIGAHLELMFGNGNFASHGKRMGWALGSGFLLLAGATVLSVLLRAGSNMDFITSYLSMAPGGMDQMSIIGHEAGADLSIVTGYQLFRIFFIFFAMPYLIRGLFSLMGKAGSPGSR